MLATHRLMCSVSLTRSMVTQCSSGCPTNRCRKRSSKLQLILIPLSSRTTPASSGAILKHILTRPHYGWAEIPIEKWRCTMAMCLALALPPKLKKVASVLGLKHQKADDKIALQMSKPRRPRGNEDPKGTYWFDDPERLQAL